jgi:hypothetical protein
MTYTKIPVTSAYESVNNVDSGASRQIRYEELEELAVDGGFLIPLSRLRPWFPNARAFRAFKQNLQIPEAHWIDAARRAPHARRYINRFITTVSLPVVRRGNKKLRMKARLQRSESDEQLDNLDDDESLLSIAPSSDECDDEDVNLPLPVCQGLRRVCRKYGTNRQYKDFGEDSSENRHYIFRVKYV